MKKKSAGGSMKDDQSIPRMTRADMRRGTMGKYANGVPHRFVELDRDVASRFRDDRAVNEALRLVIKLRESVSEKRRRTA